MVTKENLVANPVLADLTDEQIEAIETIGKNAKDAIIGKRIGEVYRQLDADILESSGIEKNGTEKTYDYAKRALSELKGKAEKRKTKLKEFEAEKQRLEKIIAEKATDKEAIRERDEAKAELAALKELYNAEKANIDTLKNEHEAKLLGIKIDSELEKATVGISFKKEYAEAAQKMILSNVINKLKSEYKHDFSDDGKMLFKDKESGALLTNPENKLNPFTASELITRELKVIDALCEGRKQAGGGGNGNSAAGAKGSFSVDVSSAKTKTEASKIVADALKERGITPIMPEYAAETKRIWEENNIAEMPIG